MSLIINKFLLISSRLLLCSAVWHRKRIAFAFAIPSFLVIGESSSNSDHTVFAVFCSSLSASFRSPPCRWLAVPISTFLPSFPFRASQSSCIHDPPPLPGPPSLQPPMRRAWRGEGKANFKRDWKSVGACISSSPHSPPYPNVPPPIPLFCLHHHR